MGSQSVTDFAAARKTRIREAIRSGDAWSAGSEAINAFTKTGHFVQALESVSVEAANKLLGEFLASFKNARSPRQIDNAFKEYGVDSENSRPWSVLAAQLQKKLDESLSISSRKTDSAFAAKDALTRTILDVLSGALPQSKEPTEASRKEVEKALRRIKLDDLARLFHRNVITSLVKASFAVARGSIPQARVERLVEEVREQLAARLGGEIANAAVKRRAKRVPRKTTGVPQVPGVLLSKPARLPGKLNRKLLNEILAEGRPSKGKERER